MIVAEDGQTLDSRERFRGRTITVLSERVRLPNGHEIELDVVRHPGAAAVVPLDADGNVLMVRQYRHTVGGWLLEIPAGKLAAGEDAATGARRELEEEAGVRAAELRELGSILVSPGFCDERIWLYLATGLASVPQRLEDDEVLSLERVPLAEAVRRAEAGEIVDAKSTCALLRAAALLRTR
ncbi:MAG TPA: NUDIX hydrolase [Thermoanaerobaculia bacterium]|jgi:ADP-ribose pyrophosphatase|nr:NUDIX hydrolase [Thermoanaerobaculia bacterium]